MYFHNDPLSMNGSKSTEDRLFLLNKIDKILFNSEWSQERFFIEIENKKLLKQKHLSVFNQQIELELILIIKN